LGEEVSPINFIGIPIYFIGMQGSNIFDGILKIDQGRSLLRETTRMFES